MQNHSGERVTSEGSGKAAIWVAALISLYLISPPIVYKISLLTGTPMSERVFVIVYAPIFPLVQHVKPYAKLIEIEAKLLRL